MVAEAIGAPAAAANKIVEAVAEEKAPVRCVTCQHSLLDSQKRFYRALALSEPMCIVLSTPGEKRILLRELR